MNTVILIGRLTSDPKLSYTPTTNTAVASFRLAVNREVKDGGADFIQCKAFGKQAEALNKYKSKGDEIGVRGRIETGSYKNKEGVTVYTTEVVCDKIEFTHGGSSEAKPPKAPDDFAVEDNFAEFDEDIPF